MVGSVGEEGGNGEGGGGRRRGRDGDEERGRLLYSKKMC